MAFPLRLPSRLTTVPCDGRGEPLWERENLRQLVVNSTISLIAEVLTESSVKFLVAICCVHINERCRSYGIGQEAQLLPVEQVRRARHGVNARRAEQGKAQGPAKR